MKKTGIVRPPANKNKKYNNPSHTHAQFNKIQKKNANHFPPIKTYKTSRVINSSAASGPIAQATFWRCTL